MPTQLGTMFMNAVNAFNAAPTLQPEYYENLLPFLHHSILMKNVDDPTTVSGIANAIFYLNSSQVIRKPIFTPDYANAKELPANSDPNIRATIKGPATYQDHSVAYPDVNGNPVAVTNPIPVTYLFSFTRKTPNDLWLLINALATP